jgi:cytochrome c oxidase cbb3-type subunit 3
VPAKGMTPYKDQLNQKQTEQLASFILSLKGSNPANAKAAQGVACE